MHLMTKWVRNHRAAETLAVVMQAAALISVAAMQAAAGTWAVVTLVEEMLVEEMLRRCEALRLMFATLEVRASNEPAIRLYERYDFVPVGRRKGYYDAPKEDAVLMTKYWKEVEESC